MPAPRAGFAALLLSAACSASSHPPAIDGSSPASDAHVFDVPPIVDGNAAGYALSFDGTKDYATAADGGFAPVSSPETLEMWVNWAAIGGAATEDFLVLRTDFVSGVQIGLHAGVLAAWRVYVDRILVQAPAAPASDSWHHVAYSYDGTTHVLYVDGAAVDSETVPGDEHTPTSVWLGTSDGSSNLFHGMLDEVRVWSVTRTAAQVVTDMGHSAPGPQDGLCAYWTFDDAVNGGRSDDLSGMGNTVTLGDGVASYMPSRVPSTAPVGN